MTETIKVEVDEELAKRFRKKAMEKYGYKKGAVKKALEGVMKDFTAQKTSKKPDWGSLVGAIKDDYKGMKSVGASAFHLANGRMTIVIDTSVFVEMLLAQERVRLAENLIDRCK